MNFDTTILRTELTVEKTETLRISRIRRFVYERSNAPKQDVEDEDENNDLAPNQVKTEESDLTISGDGMRMLCRRSLNEPEEAENEQSRTSSM